MTESATGLILRTRPLTETSLIVHWLTPEFGRLATVAKGARRARSPFLGKLDVFYRANFSFSRSRRSELHTLREVGLRDMQKELREDLHRLRLAAYAAALIERTTETETPLPGIPELMNDFLDSLCRHPPVPQMVLAFELKLLRELGLEPNPAEARLTPGAKQIARALIGNDWPAILRLKPTSTQVGELRQFLHGFLIFHLDHLPRGRSGALACEPQPPSVTREA